MSQRRNTLTSALIGGISAIIAMIIRDLGGLSDWSVPILILPIAFGLFLAHDWWRQRKGTT